MTGAIKFYSHDSYGTKIYTYTIWSSFYLNCIHAYSTYNRAAAAAMRIEKKLGLKLKGTKWREKR